MDITRYGHGSYPRSSHIRLVSPVRDGISVWTWAIVLFLLSCVSMSVIWTMESRADARCHVACLEQGWTRGEQIGGAVCECVKVGALNSNIVVVQR